MLEYTQRLRDHSRATFATTDKSSGRRLHDEILKGGAKAAGRNTGRIEAGAWADLLALDGDAIDLEGRVGDTVLDCFIFAGDDGLVRDVWAAGRHVVQDGAHVERDQISKQYRQVLVELGDVI